MPPERVAEAVIRAVENGRSEQFVPSWLRGAAVARHAVPPLYRAGAARTFAVQLDEEARTR